MTESPSRRRESPVTRAEVIREALRIVDSEGLEALSMRKLARALGIEAMSLYHHFPSKEAILDALAGSIAQDMRLPETLPDDWVELLVEMVDAFRQVLLAHPNALPVLVTRPLSPPEDAMVTPASVLAEQGLDPSRLTEMYHALMALTFGHAVVSTTGAAPRPPEADNAPVQPLTDEGFRRAARYLIEGFTR